MTAKDAEVIRTVDRPPAASFFVAGRATPAGSKRAFNHSATGKVIVLDMGGKAGKSWRAAVAYEGRRAFPGPPLTGPLEAWFDFVIARPKKHFRTGRFREVLRPEYHLVLPTGPADLTKLVRCSEDALKGVLWADDSQIVRQSASKTYGEKPGVTITVFRMV